MSTRRPSATILRARWPGRRPSWFVRSAALALIVTVIMGIPVVTSPIIAIPESGPHQTLISAADGPSPEAVDRRLDARFCGEVAPGVSPIWDYQPVVCRIAHRNVGSGQPLAGFRQRVERPPISA